LDSASDLKLVDGLKRFCDKWDARSVIRRLAQFISNQLLREFALSDEDVYPYIHLLAAAAILDEPDMFFNIAMIAVKLKWRDAVEDWAMPWYTPLELDLAFCADRRITDTRV
jgi:hypothetical protein